MNKFRPSSRLRAKKEFDFVFSAPSKIVTKYFVLLYRSNVVKSARLGIIVPKKKVQESHDRNRIKRIVREVFRTRINLPNIDLVFLARFGISTADNKALINALTAELRALAETQPT